MMTIKGDIIKGIVNRKLNEGEVSFLLILIDLKVWHNNCSMASCWHLFTKTEEFIVLC